MLKKKRVGCDEVSAVFRVLPRATSEAPNPAPSLPAPFIYCNNPPCSHLSPHLSRRVGLCTHYSEHPSRRPLFPVLLTFLEKPITVPSVLFRRAQISSQVCIKGPQLVHPHPPSFSLPCSQLYPFVQLGLSLSLSLLSLRHSLLQNFVWN